MLERLDRLFLSLRAKPVLYRFALFTRVLLAAGFIPTGLVKLLGQRFTQISPEHPIGAFFEAMFQTGLYWRFLGASQVVAGLLLLWPRFAHLGAAMFLPLMVNIFVVTVALAFRGTPTVTGLMVLAVVFLCFWDYHRFRPMLTEKPLVGVVTRHRLDPFERAGFTAFAAALIGFFLTTRSLAPREWALPLIVVGTLAGLLTLGRFLSVALGRRGAAV